MVSDRDHADCCIHRQKSGGVEVYSCPTFHVPLLRTIDCIFEPPVVVVVIKAIRAVAGCPNATFKPASPWMVEG